MSAPKLTKAQRHDPRKRYGDMKEQVASGVGLTAAEWDWFDKRMRDWEPEEYERRRAESRRKSDITAAERLSNSDLQDILDRRLALKEQSR